MKKKEITKLKSMKKAELLKNVDEAREELRGMKFDLAGGKVKNENAIRELKKKIARMLTFAKQKD